MSNISELIANYKNARQEISFLMAFLSDLRLERGGGFIPPSEDAILAAAVELYKHHNPWVQREYGTEPF
jgi:hypothetical protein